MSLLPPGRFLMPGDLAGSPALTFAPLDVPADGTAPDGSLWAMMERRYEAYKDVVVRPFFRDHFARLDRQIVLVDALAAFNAGPGSAARSRSARSPGSSIASGPAAARFFSSLFRPRIDRILFAATKADHLHHSSHDRLEAVLRRTVAKAAERAEYAGAAIDVVALAAVRATREARSRAAAKSCRRSSARPRRRDANGETFDGETEVATFPGDLPADPERTVQGTRFAASPAAPSDKADYRFLRFRPPLLEQRRAARSRPCLTSASTAPSSS